MSWLLIQHLGDYFGGRAVELSGIITGPEHQGRNRASAMAQEYVDQHGPEQLIAYTRNPAVLNLLNRLSHQKDVLVYNNPYQLALTIPHATVGDDGILYHIDRYAPDGLYGSFDPADGPYDDQVLKDRCRLLHNKNTALAVSVVPKQAHTL